MADSAMETDEQQAGDGAASLPASTGMNGHAGAPESGSASKVDDDARRASSSAVAPAPAPAAGQQTNDRMAMDDNDKDRRPSESDASTASKPPTSSTTLLASSSAAHTANHSGASSAATGNSPAVSRQPTPSAGGAGAGTPGSRSPAHTAGAPHPARPQDDGASALAAAAAHLSSLAHSRGGANQGAATASASTTPPAGAASSSAAPAPTSHPQPGVAAPTASLNAASTSVASTSSAIPASAPAPAAGVGNGPSAAVNGNPNGLPNPLPPNYNPDLPICANCSTQTTPLWRRSPDSNAILCNACALFFKMKGRPRPISLKTDVIKSRNRSKGAKSSSKDRAGPNGPAALSTVSAASATGGGLAQQAPAVTPAQQQQQQQQASRPPAKAQRSESSSRSKDDLRTGSKSLPGGSEMDEDDELAYDGRTTAFGDAVHDDGTGRKARRTMPSFSAGGARGVSPGGQGQQQHGATGPIHHSPAHSHAASRHPYSSAARSQSRSRSLAASASRRAASVEGRAHNSTSTSTPQHTPSPPMNAISRPPGESHGNPYHYPAGQYGAPGSGFAYPTFNFHQPYGGSAQSQQQPGTSGQQHHHHPLSITHAQSDSRSQSSSGPDDNAMEAHTAGGALASNQSSARSSASPPHHPQSQAYYQHPNPNYALHQQRQLSSLYGSQQQQQQSGLRPPHGAAPTAPGAESPLRRSPSASRPANEDGASHMLPPINEQRAGDEDEALRHAAGKLGGAGAGGRDRATSLHLPSIASVSGGSPSSNAVRSSSVTGAARYAAQQRAGPPLVPPPAKPVFGTHASDETTATLKEHRAQSVSTDDGASNSSDGVRSPETFVRAATGGWQRAGGGGSRRGGADDERRGRSEHRDVMYLPPATDSVSGDELNEVDELDEDAIDPPVVPAKATLHQQLPTAQPYASSYAQYQQRYDPTPFRPHDGMTGVESGFNELRVGGVNAANAAVSRGRGAVSATRGTSSNRGASRSSGSGSSRGRSSMMGGGPFDDRGRALHKTMSGTTVTTGRSVSTSRGRPSGPGSVAAGPGSAPRSQSRPRTSPHDEMARLRTRVAELSFLNSLLLSRLQQVEGGVPASLMGIVERSGGDEYDFAGAAPLDDDADTPMQFDDDPRDSSGHAAEPHPPPSPPARDAAAALEAFGVTAKDPVMASRLADFLRFQQQQQQHQSSTATR